MNTKRKNKELAPASADKPALRPVIFRRAEPEASPGKGTAPPGCCSGMGDEEGGELAFREPHSAPRGLIRIYCIKKGGDFSNKCVKNYLTGSIVKVSDNGNLIVSTGDCSKCAGVSNKWGHISSSNSVNGYIIIS